jgi:phage minor structural protein
MVKIFDTTDTDFGTNGDIIIQPLKAKVHKEDNGDYYLDLEVGIEHAQYITSGKIAVVKTPQGEQGFRIRSTTKTQYKITAKCWHLYYDLYFNAFIYQYKIDYYKPISEIITDLTTWANYYVYPELPQWDITTDSTESVFCASYSRCTFFDALADLVSRTDAHLVRNNFNVLITQSIEQDNGFTIRYGNNLKEITKVESWDNVCTRCYPTGKEGVMPLMTPFVESAVQYDLAFCKNINFAQDDIKREYYQSQNAYIQALQANLGVVAQEYVDSACYPEVSYSLKAYIDRVVDVGEIIQVKDDTLDMDLLTKVTSYEYDCISGLYTDITFGNHVKTAKGLGSRLDLLWREKRGAVIGENQLVFGDDGVVTYVPITMY